MKFVIDLLILVVLFALMFHATVVAVSLTIVGLNKASKYLKRRFKHGR